MKNDTLTLLADAAWARQRERDRTDPELLALWGEYQEKLEGFQSAHRRDPKLRAEVLRLLDLHDALEDAHSLLHFRMGLQMGLELGALDVLREE